MDDLKKLGRRFPEYNRLREKEPEKSASKLTVSCVPCIRMCVCMYACGCGCGRACMHVILLTIDLSQKGSTVASSPGSPLTCTYNE